MPGLRPGHGDPGETQICVPRVPFCAAPPYHGATRSGETTMTEFNQPLGGNDMPRFAGPATMMRLPSQATAKGLDVCFVGVPIDIGSSNRSGTRHGPRQIRAESCMIRPYNMATRAKPFESFPVADIGDVAINTFDLKK